MDSLPIEIIETIFMFVNPKDYTNFILSYNVALQLWRSEKIRNKYKEQYLRIIREDFVDNSGIYVMKTIRVDNNERHGKYIIHYENGQIWMDAAYQNSKIHGKCIEYHKNGQIRLNTTYQNGRMRGKYTRYYENGQIWIDTTCQIIRGKSQMHGKYVEYYENGMLHKDTTCRKDQIHGKYVEYYENGEIYKDIMYKNGQVL
jgi:antitoxin component YwqK of YwqJK toxin-antitoxin module